MTSQPVWKSIWSNLQLLLYTYSVKASSANTPRPDLNNISIFIDCGIFNEVGGVHFLQDFNVDLYFYLVEKCTRHTLLFQADDLHMRLSHRFSATFFPEGGSGGG